MSNNAVSYESDLDFNLEAIIPKLEKLRTLIVYDSRYVVRSLIFGHIVPSFSSKDVYIAVYSDTMMRRLGKTYESLPDGTAKKLLSEANIVKVGQNHRIPFGKLHSFIDIHSEWWEEFADVLSELDDVLLIFHGFSLLPMVYGDEAWKFLMDIFDSLPDDVTFVNKISSSLYEKETKQFFERFHDVVIRIRWESELFPIGRTYWIGVEQSIIFDIKPGYARYKISGEVLSKLDVD